MLINLSNHPFDQWSESQTAAAIEQFGDVIDLPFPQIEPNASKVDVHHVAQDYLLRVQQLGSPINTSIHIGGEMTLTYALVRFLQEAGYRCYASTSSRDSIEIEQGKKTVIFQFVAFREY